MNSEELIKMLVLLSRSDKDFDENEFAYLLNVAERLGLSQARFERLVRQASEFEINSPPSEHDRMRMLYYLLFLMKIDKRVTEEETGIIHHYGFKLGFSRAMINDFIDLISQYQEHRVPEEEMIDIIRKYSN